MKTLEKNLKTAIQNKDRFAIEILYNRLLQNTSHDDIMTLLNRLIEESGVESARKDYFENQ